MSRKKTVVPWWMKFTPLTQKQEDELALPVYIAYEQMIAGKATVNHFGTILARLRVGKKLVKHFEGQAELYDLLDKAIAEVWHCINHYKTGVEFKAKVGLIHDAIKLVDDMTRNCEKFRVSNAINEVAREK